MSGRGVARRTALMEERSMVDWGCCAGDGWGEGSARGWRGFFCWLRPHCGRVCGAADEFVR
jgi:hypothetical protein